MSTFDERFWSHVYITDQCWLWTASKRNGYGQTFLDGRNHAAHRIAYELLVGPIPKGYEVDHLCHDENCPTPNADCPHRACVRPEHLQAVTKRENILRARGTGAVYARRSHCPNGHEFDTLPYIRGRVCLTCRREKHREYMREWRARR